MLKIVGKCFKKNLPKCNCFKREGKKLEYTCFRCDCIDGKEEIKKEWNKYKNNNAILIDVRSLQEFKEGHIEGAISIPYYELYKRAYKELKDKNQKILLYCNTGSRSKRAGRILKQMGYTDVKEIYKA